METLDHLFLQNRAWSEGNPAGEAHFFWSWRSNRRRNISDRLLGCGCRRTKSWGWAPGRLLRSSQHANLVSIRTDCLSVINSRSISEGAFTSSFADITVAAGGAALRRERLGLSDNWLRHVHDVRQQHDNPFESSRTQAVDRLCDLTDRTGEQRLPATILQDAWARGRTSRPRVDLRLHGGLFARPQGPVTPQKGGEDGGLRIVNRGSGQARGKSWPTNMSAHCLAR